MSFEFLSIPLDTILVSFSAFVFPFLYFFIKSEQPNSGLHVPFHGETVSTRGSLMETGSNVAYVNVVFAKKQWCRATLVSSWKTGCPFCTVARILGSFLWSNFVTRKDKCHREGRRWSDSAPSISKWSSRLLLAFGPLLVSAFLTI